MPKREFKAKREKVPPSGLRSKKGNLKAKTGIYAKREFKKPKREICPPSGLRSKKGNLKGNSRIGKFAGLIASNAKFPFAQNSRFNLKREKCPKGNLA